MIFSLKNLSLLRVAPDGNVCTYSMSFLFGFDFEVISTTTTETRRTHETSPPGVSSVLFSSKTVSPFSISFNKSSMDFNPPFDDDDDDDGALENVSLASIPRSSSHFFNGRVSAFPRSCSYRLLPSSSPLFDDEFCDDDDDDDDDEWDTKRWLPPNVVKALFLFRLRFDDARSAAPPPPPPPPAAAAAAAVFGDRFPIIIILIIILVDAPL